MIDLTAVTDTAELVKQLDNAMCQLSVSNKVGLIVVGNPNERSSYRVIAKPKGSPNVQPAPMVKGNGDISFIAGDVVAENVDYFVKAMEAAQLISRHLRW